MHYHKIIKDLRVDNNISQQTIANYIGIDRVTYNRLENEKYSIKFDYIIKIAEFYNVSIDYLAGLIKTPDPLNSSKQSNAAAIGHTRGFHKA